MPDALDGGSGRGFYLQDAGYPQHLAWVLHALVAPLQIWRWREGATYLVKNWIKGTPDTDVTAKIAELMQPAELSAGGLPLLGMGRDVPDGQDVPARRPPRHQLGASPRARRTTSIGCAARRATSPPRSAAASPTTRCGSSSA